MWLWQRWWFFFLEVILVLDKPTDLNGLPARIIFSGLSGHGSMVWNGTAQHIDLC